MSAGDRDVLAELMAGDDREQPRRHCHRVLACDTGPACSCSCAVCLATRLGDREAMRGDDAAWISNGETFRS